MSWIEEIWLLYCVDTFWADRNSSPFLLLYFIDNDWVALSRFVSGFWGFRAGVRVSISDRVMVTVDASVSISIGVRLGLCLIFPARQMQCLLYLPCKKWVSSQEIRQGIRQDIRLDKGKYERKRKGKCKDNNKDNDKDNTTTKTNIKTKQKQI